MIFQAVEIPGILIIQIAGGLHFANTDILEKKIFKTIKENISVRFFFINIY